MAQNTTRDRLWTFAVKRTLKQGNSITAPELAKMADTSERSARDVLKTMVGKEILREDKKGREVRYIPVF